MSRAALYLRSSKDRNDVSIDAQRRELGAFASQRSLTIVREYADAVESGKDEDRPAFQQLLTALKDTARGWDHLLMVDTSRLSRRQHIAHVFDHECQKRGITVLYSKLPPVDPLTDMLVKSILRAFDEFHSHMSRLKGLAGMAENVRQGWRAGGRAPRGYKLEHTETGAVREGEPVRKSRLVPSHEAPVVAKYLKARVLGGSRRSLAKAMKLPESSLNDLEWNALTYAGHTVWNMRRSGKGLKRKPRSEWAIQRDTHKALITDREAEVLLVRLEHYSAEASRRTKPTYLLTGILFAPDGRPWRGNGTGHYRLHGSKSKHVSADELERGVLGQVQKDIESAGFVDRLVAETRKRYAKPDTRPAGLKAEMGKVEAQIARTMELAGELADPGPALRRVDGLERTRKRLEGELRTVELEMAQAEALRDISPKRVREALTALATDLGSPDRDAVKEALRGLLERVTLTPDGKARLTYRGGI